MYPVNPGAGYVRSVQAYASIADVPAKVDLAVLCVPSEKILGAVEQCGQAGVRGLVIITAGFSEIGGDGAAREAGLKRLLKRFNMRAVGPNCLGVVNTAASTQLNATFAPHYPPAGKVAFASQSGALGVAILDQAKDLGIGISHFVSVGNRADLHIPELLEFWQSDSGTDVILLYLESFGDPTGFSRVARQVSRTTPIVAVKGGRTMAGQKAASSHTGALAGQDAAAAALFHQAGVIRVDTVEELFDMAMLLANQPLPGGGRLGILTNAGGPGILAADCAEASGLSVPGLSERTRLKLSQFLPPEASLANPVDLIAAGGPQEFDRAAGVLLESGEIDALLAIFVPPVASDTDGVAQRLVAHAENAAIPMVTCFLGSHGLPEALSTLEGGNVPSYRYPEAAVRALARARDYALWKKRPVEAAPAFQDVDQNRAKAALEEVQADGWLTPDGARSLIEAYGIFHVESRFVATEEEAAQVAENLGYPLVMKLVADGVVHKSDVQGVRLGLRDASQVRASMRRMRQDLETLGGGGAFRGVLLQPMVTQGVEVAVGSVVDPALGQLVMVGTGGVNLELLGDVRFGLHPLSKTDVQENIRSLRGFPLLDGYRNRPKADVAALETLVLRVDRLLKDCPEILEMDLNPVLVLPQGLGCTVVDVRVRVQQAEGASS